MASSIALLLQFLCIAFGAQARRFHHARVGRHIPVANVLLNLNPHSTRRSSRSPSRSDAELSPLIRLPALSAEVESNPLIRLQAIATSLVAPGVAFAEEGTSQADQLPVDDLLRQALDVTSAILQNIKYVIEHAGDLSIVAVVLFFAAKLFSPSKASSQSGPSGPPPFLQALNQQKNQPKEFLKIERLNEKLESFDYSFEKAVVSEKAAMRKKQKLSFNRRFGAELASFNLDTKVLDDIAKAEQDYRTADAILRGRLSNKLSQMRTSAMQKDNSSNPMDRMMKMTGKSKSELAAIQAERFQLETDFLSSLSKSLSSEHASRIAEILKVDEQAPTVDEQPFSGSLEAVASLENIAASAIADSKHVWVLKFNGDVAASQVATLRQEITALLRKANATRGDEVLLVLNTGGGTVTGYGLAAAQLMRIKKAGIHLTIAVEQVAASGGYMMACVADKLVSSPFAVLGSIGVITEQPNVYERLKKEGISFSTVTAGKYKRTLTPTKKIEEQDKQKLKEDIERILVLFKEFVAKSRPGLDIDKVATGETWFGPDALEEGLVDGLSTVDELLTDYIDQGAEVYSY